jgi:hypothetical protein
MLLGRRDRQGTRREPDSVARIERGTLQLPAKPILGDGMPTRTCPTVLRNAPFTSASWRIRAGTAAALWWRVHAWSAARTGRLRSAERGQNKEVDGGEDDDVEGNDAAVPPKLFRRRHSRCHHASRECCDSDDRETAERCKKPEHRKLKSSDGSRGRDETDQPAGNRQFPCHTLFPVRAVPDNHAAKLQCRTSSV